MRTYRSLNITFPDVSIIAYDTMSAYADSLNICSYDTHSAIYCFIIFVRVLFHWGVGLAFGRSGFYLMYGSTNDSFMAWRSGSVMDYHATARGSIPGGNGVKTELHVLRKGQ